MMTNLKHQDDVAKLNSTAISQSGGSSKKYATWRNDLNDL